MIKMKELPYPLDALEPYYNRETLDIHYNIYIKDMLIIQTKHRENWQKQGKREILKI